MQEGQIVGVIKFNKMRTKTCTKQLHKPRKKYPPHTHTHGKAPTSQKKLDLGDTRNDPPRSQPPDLNPQPSAAKPTKKK